MNHPHPTDNQLDGESIAALRLNLVPGVGPRIFQQLMEAFSTSQAALAAAPSDLRSMTGIGSKLAQEISGAVHSIDVEPELSRCRKHGIDILQPRSRDYPNRLKEIIDPPPILYKQGVVSERDDFAIAIVGTRHPSPYGKAQAERFSRGLALAGLTIISGLARGIDAIAHEAALKAGGRTIAVLGSGLLNLYPPDHRQLADQISVQGAVVSEFPTMQPPKAGAFPRRNRVISGLSLGVVVIEAAERSGALISATHANEQGREVFALPGRVDQRNSRGCHRLIRDGAKLVESVDDVLNELGPLPHPAQIRPDQKLHHPGELLLNEREQLVLHAIQPEPTSIDSIVANTKLPVHQVLAVVSVLEMRHLVRRLSGTSLCRI